MEEHRARTPGLADEAMVYAGRLDPMAEGLLLVLTGEDRFGLAAHLTHDKDYVATFLFGVSSDTHDALGRLVAGPVSVPPPKRCGEALAGLVGTHTLPLPVWSAYRVRGRPLHAWAREGRIHEIAVPTRDMTVTSVRAVSSEAVHVTTLLYDVRTRVTRVRGDFRQSEVLADWARLGGADLPLVTVTVALTVTSGTYVRALAHAVGTQLGCGGLLLALRRTRVGPYRA